MRDHSLETQIHILPNSSEAEIPTEQQGCKYMNRLGPFSLKLPHHVLM